MAEQERRPVEGSRPSARARQRLVAELEAELAVTRAAWEDARDRGEQHLRAADLRGASRTLEDQRRLLRLLECRLDGVVAAATHERET